jgi:hypothetical protein
MLRCIIKIDTCTSVISPLGVAARVCGVLLCDARAAVAEVPENYSGLNQTGGFQCNPGLDWGADLEQLT